MENVTSPELDDMPEKSLNQLAWMVRRDWKKPYFGAEPYIQALQSMGAVSESYGMDSGRSIVLYFLSNAHTWRGPVARAVKAELKRRAGL